MASREVRDEQQTAAPALTPDVPAPVGTAPPLDLQRALVELILDDWEAAKTARAARTYGKTAKGETLDFDRWLKELTDLYFGRREPKETPWRFCSNRSMMIAMAILETLHARLFPAVYNEDSTRWRPTEPTDEGTAERVEALMFWWVRVHAKLRDFFDRWVRSAIAYGTVVSVARWAVTERDTGDRAAGSLVPNPDGTVGTTPGPIQPVLHETTRSELVPLEDLFLQPGAQDVQTDTILLRRKFLYRDLTDMEARGTVVNVRQPSVVGTATIKSLLVVPVPPSPGLPEDQRLRLEEIKRRNLPVETLEWYGSFDLDGDGFDEPLRVLISPVHRLFLGAVPIRDLSGRGLRHLDITRLFPRLDEPNGLWGLGVLEQVKELALEIDAIFNQMTDANSLSVLRPGFYNPSGDVEPAALNLAPNKWIPVSNPKDQVYLPEINIPTERLMLAIRMVLEFVERLTAASAYIMGKESEIVGGSGTATRTQAIVGAASQRHSIPVASLREGVARILTQHLDLVQQNLPPGMEQRILGQKGERLFESPLIREGIATEMDCYLLPDEALGSKETERQLSQLLWSILSQSLIVASDPTKQYKPLADILKAYGKDPEAYLGVAPDVKQTHSPQDENTMMLEGKFASIRVSVLDNPIEHVMEHQALLQDAAFQLVPDALKAQVQQFMLAHIQEHIQTMAVIAQAAQAQKGGGHVPSSNGRPAGGGRPSRGGPGATPTVGPEPGVGSVREPRAQAGAIQRGGESGAPSGG